VPDLVNLRASRYVNAVQAVHRSIRLWHRMDATFVAMRQYKGPHVEELLEAHRLLDGAPLAGASRDARTLLRRWTLAAGSWGLAGEAPAGSGLGEPLRLVA
jgi:hypothetical protein